MTELPVAAGPPCDGCGAELAVMSLMNYADYSQMKLGPSCGPDFLRTIADSIDGRSTVTPAEPEPVDPLAADTLEGRTAAELGGGQDDDTAGTGSAAEHWASTTNVRRSTHGHRTPRASSPRAKPADPE